MKAKNVISKIYVSSNANLGYSETFVESQLQFVKSFLSPPYTIRYRSKKRSV